MQLSLIMPIVLFV